MGFCFMQDGNRVLRCQEKLEVISRVFGPNIIALDAKAKTAEGKVWSQYSPDLNPCTYSLWGLIKIIVYYASQGLQQNIKVLKELIEATINDETVYKIIDHF